MAEFFDSTVHRTIRDAVYGSAVGDALGRPYEFANRGSFRCTGMTEFEGTPMPEGACYGCHSKPSGTWTDDTSMTLATCDSLRELGRVDTDDMRSRFRQWLDHGKYTIDGLFDCGITTSAALDLGHGCDGERDNGNGSLMRIAPLAFTTASDDDVRRVSAVTHAHRISLEACVVYVRYARRLLHGIDPCDALKDLGTDLAGMATTTGVPLDDLTVVPSLSVEQVASGGFVLDSLVASLWCLTSTSDYATCVLKAVDLGRDTDTTADIAGALAGIVYGRDAIPQDWLEALRGKDVIDACLW